MELNREMTNEEAIKWLVAIEEKYIHGGDESFDNQRRIALHLARNALSLIKELTEENANLHASCTELTQSCTKLTEENERLSKDVADLQDELKCEKETNEHLCGEYMSENHLRHQAEEMLANGMSVVKADTVRKMHHLIWLEFSDCTEEETVSVGSFRASVDQIAKEMVEGSNG